MNFVDCESFLESNSPDILALCETNLDDSNDSGNFSVGDYLPLIQKDCSTRTSFSTELISRKLSFCTELISRKLCRFLSSRNTLVFVLQWLSLHWEILIMLLSQFPLTFQLIHNRIPISLHNL